MPHQLRRQIRILELQIPVFIIESGSKQPQPTEHIISYLKIYSMYVEKNIGSGKGSLENMSIKFI